jgi:Icc-related predicted phosphoesterase
MKIAFFSDAHLDFKGATANLMMTEWPDADLMIIAGDLVELKYIESALPVLKLCNEKYEKTIWIPGNHEYYGIDINDDAGIVQSYLDENGLQRIFYTSRGVTTHHDIKIVCSTLWTDFNNGSPMATVRWSGIMSDATMIHDRESLSGRISAERIHELHDCCVSLIEQNIDDKIIVVSHHAPSFESANAYYRAQESTSYYCSDLVDLMFDAKDLPLWIHGHLHDAVDYTCANTRIVSNPCGYYGFESCANRIKIKVVEV